ncbi:hypothetical protein ACIO7M_33180 [Streptomyces toxytricini]|uniref:Uncharacterized protein n=1 Tax=Streptomyces toxytricini TaxID=67369 RepID=A0ABW8ES15_STRT5
MTMDGGHDGAAPTGEADVGAGGGVVPGPGAVGELGFEQKFDGYRALAFTDSGLVPQTRQGKCIQDRFPDLLAAAE